MSPHPLRRFPVSRLWMLLEVLSTLICCLFEFYQAKVSIVRRLVQGRYNMTRVRVEPETLQFCRNDDAFNFAATQPTMLRSLKASSRVLEVAEANTEFWGTTRSFFFRWGEVGWGQDANPVSNKIFIGAQSCNWGYSPSPPSTDASGWAYFCRKAYFKHSLAGDHNFWTLQKRSKWNLLYFRILIFCYDNSVSTHDTLAIEGLQLALIFYYLSNLCNDSL